METIELKPQYLRLTIRTLLLALVWFSIISLLRYGLFASDEIWLFLRGRCIEAIIATSVFFVSFMILCPPKNLSILLTDETLKAPARTTFGLKSLTADLSDISVSRSLKDRFLGRQLVTRDGKMFRIPPGFYPAKSVPNLFIEIEKRQKMISNPNQSTHSITGSAGSE